MTAGGPGVITLPVGGMTCAACQGHVERALRAQPGVADVTVNLVTRAARVTVDPAVADVAGLVAAVDAAGYHAELPLADDDVLVVGEPALTGRKGYSSLPAFATALRNAGLPSPQEIQHAVRGGVA